MLPQGARDLQDIVEAEVALATFNAADVGWVKAGALGQAFLCQAVGEPKLPDTTSESLPI